MLLVLLEHQLHPLFLLSAIVTVFEPGTKASLDRFALRNPENFIVSVFSICALILVVLLRVCIIHQGKFIVRIRRGAFFCPIKHHQIVLDFLAILWRVLILFFCHFLFV